MNEIYELKEMLMKELEEYGRKGELKDVGSLDVVDKLAHSIKNLCKIIEAEEMEGESSMASYARGGSRAMGGQSSYARGRTGNVRRDSRGRYSREGDSYRGGSYNDMSMRGSYRNSYAAEGMEDMIESIQEVMHELPPDVKKDAEKLLQKLEQQMM